MYIYFDLGMIGRYFNRITAIVLIGNRGIFSKYIFLGNQFAL